MKARAPLCTPTLPLVAVLMLVTVLLAPPLPAASTPKSARTARPLHCLWELSGKRNTVFVLGSIHVLRSADYPLAPELLEAYAHAEALVMEIDLQQVDPKQVQSDMVASATLPQGETLPEILGPRRYAHAAGLAHQAGVELAAYDRFAPWFAAEAISQVQLTRLGFEPADGVEMYFLGRAQSDGKPIAGLETVRDQIALFAALPLKTQASYLESSLEEAGQLPTEIDGMVRAWQHGDTAWLASHVTAELAKDPALYHSLLAARNRQWVPKIEALLDDDKNYLVIVGTGHLVGRDSVIALLKRDGVGAPQR